MSVCPAAWAVPGQGSNPALILAAWEPQSAPIPSWGSSDSSAGKGGSLHPTSHSAGGDPPALTEQWDFTLPTQGAGRSWHGLLARPGVAPSLCTRSCSQGSWAHPPTHHVWGRGPANTLVGMGETEKSWGPKGWLGGSRLQKAAE